MLKLLPTRIAGFLAALLATCSVAPGVLAQEEADTIDSARGLVTGSTRRIGLAGAFVALADDTEGVAINPASVALRLPHSWSAFDYGLGIDVAVGAWLPESDVYNQPDDGSGENESTLLFGSLAAVLYYHRAGIGVAAEAQRNAGTRADQMQGFNTDLAANFGMVHSSLGYGFLEGQLLIGAGTRIVGMSFDRESNASGSLSNAGLGYEVGVTIKPTVAQYRVAAAFKSPIDAKLPADTSGEQGTFHVPWEASVGVAYQFGRRPFNPPFVTAEQLARQSGAGAEPTPSELKQAEDELYERYLRLQRRYVLLSGELSVIEGGGQVGFSRQAADDQPILSPRVGLETEIIAHHLRLRGGSYYEPALTREATPRVHGTGGLDVRLFRWNVFGLVDRFDYWQLSLAADAARAYLNTSFSIGFWH